MVLSRRLSCPVRTREGTTPRTVKRLLTYLREHAGHAYCQDCLAQAIGAPRGTERDIVASCFWASRDLTDPVVQVGACAVCGATKRVIRRGREDGFPH